MQFNKLMAVQAFARLCGVCGITDTYFRKQDDSVSIFLFHRICDDESMGVTLPVFKGVMEYIRNSYTVIGIDEAYEYLIDKKLCKNQKRYAIITFDDGYLDNYTQALPVLREYKLPATLFACTGFIDSGYSNWEQLDAALLRRKESILDLSCFCLGCHSFTTDVERRATVTQVHKLLKVMPQKDMDSLMARIIEDSPAGSARGRSMMNWDELRDFAGTPGMTIGAHTVTHPNLVRISESALREELNVSKKVLEDRLDVPIRHFAYPSGIASASVERAVREAGFVSASLVEDGINRKGCDLFKLLRRSVIQDCCIGSDGNYSDEVFSMFASGFRQVVGTMWRNLWSRP